MTLLIDKIKEDMLAARKNAANDEKYGALKAKLLVTLYSEASRPGLDDGKRKSTDEEVRKVIGAFLKGNKEVLDATAPKGGMVSQAFMNAAIEEGMLRSYMPKLLTKEELTDIINDYIAHGVNTMPAIMKALKDSHPNEYDGKEASTLIRSLIP